MEGGIHNTDFGPEIARREFELDGKLTVTALIAQPYPVDDGGSWFCPVRIEGLGDGKVRRAGGVDAVQAIHLALKLIATLLYTSDEYKGGRLRWLNQSNLGLPVADAIADLVPPEDE